MERIRKATADDRDRVIEMAVLFLATTRFGQLVTPNEQALELLFDICLRRGCILLAEDVVESTCCKPGMRWTFGFLAMAYLPHPISGELFADEVAWWIDPNHRGGRSAYYLERAAREEARQMGCSVLKMVAPIDSDVGKFLVRRGYTPVETAYQVQLKE